MPSESDRRRALVAALVDVLALPLLLVSLNACSPPTADVPLLAGVLASDTDFAHRNLDPRSVHRFEVELDHGWALRLEIDQQNVDVVATIRKAGRRQDPLAIFDSPIGRRAGEKLCFVADEPGQHYVDISPFTESGSYSLRVTALRQASEQDQLCSEAYATFQRAQHAPGTELRGSVRLYGDAGRSFEEAGELFLAAVSWREAGTLWLRAGAPERASKAHERARELANRAQSAFLTVSILNRLGLAYRDLGDLERAASAFEAARREATASDDNEGLASALTNLGRLGPDLGTPHTALDHLRQALDLWRKLGNIGQQAQTLINQGTTLGTLGRPEDADNALTQALALARGASDLQRAGSALQALGWSQYLAGDPGSGLEHLEQALELYRSLEDLNGMTSVLDRLGTLRAASGDETGAIDAYRSALALLADESNPRDTAASSANLGCLLVDRGELEEGARLLDSAQSYYSVSTDPKAAAHIQFCRAKLSSARGNLALATDRVERSLGIVDRLRRQASAQGHFYLPLGLWRDYADLAIDLRLEALRANSDPELLAGAFEIHDQARAWTLFEQVVQRQPETPSQELPDPAEARVRLLQARLNLLAQTRRGLQDRSSEASRLFEIEAELRQLALDLEDARADIRARARGAGRLGSPRAVSVPEIQSRLSEGTALLAYRLGPQGSHLFVLTNQRLDVWPLPDQKILEEQAKTLYQSLNIREVHSEQWKLIAESLARKLLPPRALGPDIRRLSILADGLLHYVAFAILASPRHQYEIGPETHTLIDDFELHYLPSAAVFLALEDRRRRLLPPVQTAAVFADPVLNRDDDRLGGSGAASDGSAATSEATETSSDIQPSRGLPIQQRSVGALPRLPYTAREAAAFERLLPPAQRQIWTGFEAEKQAVLTTDLSSFRILHFATHAFVDELLPELSGLVLSRHDADGRPIDGDLHLHEIQNLELNAELTVLSGCQTALGKHVRGNGLLGLTHGFFDAGSAQVLVTLWKVDDKAAAFLMDLFYEHLLGEGLDPAASLRGAQRNLRRRPGFEAPYYWAPFTLHGAS